MKNDPRSCERNLCNYEKKPEKKKKKEFRTSTGVEPVGRTFEPTIDLIPTSVAS